MNQSRIAVRSLLCALGLALAAPAQAQIVNSLRGFSESESGFSGTLEALFTVARGNSDYLDWSAGVTGQYQTSRHRARVIGSWNRRTAEGATLADNNLVHLRHNLRFADRWSTVLFGQSQRDPFRRIARRTLAGGGLRWDILRNETVQEDGSTRLQGQVSLGATLMHEAEEWTDDDRGTRHGERFSFFARGFGVVRDGVSLDLTGFYQPRPGDFRDSRALVGLNTNVDLVGSLRLILRYDLIHDAVPPRGVAPTDYRFRSGLSLGL